MRYSSPHTYALIKAASQAKEKTYAPDILAHELGHARYHQTVPGLHIVRTLAPVAGEVVNVMTDTPYGLVGHAIPIADEAIASRRAIKTMREWGSDEEDISAAKKRLGVALSSYTAGPAVDAGLAVTGFVTGSRELQRIAPMAGLVTEMAAGPAASRVMKKIPIKARTERDLRTLMREKDPETEVHFAKKPLRMGGAYMNRPLTETTARLRRKMPVYEHIRDSIGSRASDRLIRKGGVVIGPTE